MIPLSPNDVILLMVDDDQDDCMMTQRALRGTPLEHSLRFAEDGADLMDYLNKRGRYSEPGSSPCPDLILLDLNMPRMNGLEALRELKSNPAFRSIPVVVMTTSKGQEDVLAAYELGANAFVTKPVIFSALREVMQKLGEFWFDIAKRPHHGHSNSTEEA